jgi:hypothetical protein
VCAKPSQTEATRRLRTPRRAWTGGPGSPLVPFHGWPASRSVGAAAINSAHDSRGLCIHRSTINASPLSQRKKLSFTTVTNQSWELYLPSPSASGRWRFLLPLSQQNFILHASPAPTCARTSPRRVRVTAKFLLAVRKSAWLVTGSGPSPGIFLTLGLSTTLFRCERRRNGQETAQPRRPLQFYKSIGCYRPYSNQV